MIIEHDFIKTSTISFLNVLKNYLIPYERTNNISIPVAIMNSGDVQFLETFNDPENSKQYVSKVPQIIVMPPKTINVEQESISSPFIRSNFNNIDINSNKENQNSSNSRYLKLKTTIQCYFECSNLLQSYQLYEYLLHTIYPNFNFSYQYNGKTCTGICVYNAEFDVEFDIEFNSSSKKTAKFDINFDVTLTLPILYLYNNSSVHVETNNSKHKIKVATDNVHNEKNYDILDTINSDID